MTTPDWLTQREGRLEPVPQANTWAVLLNGSPQYRLVAAPAAGAHFTCALTQTVNGKRLDSGATYPTAADAIRGGLEELRKLLGWG